MQLTPRQAARLVAAYEEIGSVLRETGVIEARAPEPAEPAWMTTTGKQWRLLNDLARNHNSDLGVDAWGRLGREHGYDPRGLGGFFVGNQPLMASQGARRVLTSHGHRFIERWSKDFAAEE